MSDVEIVRAKRRARPGAERTTSCGLGGANVNDARRGGPTTEHPAAEAAPSDGTDAVVLVTLTTLAG